MFMGKCKTFGLAGCICWAMFGLSSVFGADPNQPIDINEPAYLHSIGLIKGEPDQGIPVGATVEGPAKMADMSRVMIDNSPVEQGEGELRGGTCTVVYSNTTQEDTGNPAGNYFYIMPGSNLIQGDNVVLA